MSVMAKIIIRKGFLSQGGKLHKAGEVVIIADANLAKRLVARSGGDLDFYHGPEIASAEEKETENPEAESEEAGDASESDTQGEENSGETGDELPALNAAAAVKTSKPTRTTRVKKK